MSLTLSTKLADADVDAIVDQVTGGYRGPRHLSEARTVLVPAKSSLRFDGIKIKGAGLYGGPIRFDRPHEVPFALPRYDAEGNYTEDLARGFDRAPQGGMSWQQATNEHRIVAWLCEHGFDTLPALGHGVVDLDGCKSWLCLLNAPFREAWTWAHDPPFDRDLVWEMPVAQARGQKELRRLGVCLGLNGVTSVGGRLVRKDFHAARFVDRNDTFVSRTLYELFDVNFCLWNYVDPRAQPGLPDWTRRATHAYLTELLGDDPDDATIADFRSTTWIFRDARLALPLRMALLERNPISRHVLSLFASEEEREELRSAEATRALPRVLAHRGLRTRRERLDAKLRHRARRVIMRLRRGM